MIIVVNVIVTILIFVEILTFGIVTVYLYIKALAKLFDWIDRKN